MNAMDWNGPYDALPWAIYLGAGLLALAGLLFLLKHFAPMPWARRRHDDREQRTRTLALYDEHTMMRNRASFQLEVVAWIQRCGQTRQSFDLFHGVLKFADAMSERQIEAAMRDIAGRLRPRLRDSDVLARFSDTEFIVLRLREHAADLPLRLHEQLHVICSQPIQHSDGMILPLAHLGSAQFPDDGRHSRTLLQVAQRQAAMLAMPVPLQRVA